MKLLVSNVGSTSLKFKLFDMPEERVLCESYADVGLTHSETLLPMIDTALKAAGLTVDDLDVLGVTNGPGSFTGLRIGLSVVKGLALPRQIPCAGVSTMAALAYGLAAVMHSPYCLFISLLISWCMGAILSVIAYRRGKWRKKAIVKKEEA